MKRLAFMPIHATSQCLRNALLDPMLVHQEPPKAIRRGIKVPRFTSSKRNVQFVAQVFLFERETTFQLHAKNRSGVMHTNEIRTSQSSESRKVTKPYSASTAEIF